MLGKNNFAINLFIILLSLFIFSSCCDCDKNEEAKKTPIVGKMSWEIWQKNADWNDYSSLNYSPDEEIIAEIKNILSSNQELSFIIVSASWCSDSESEVPKIFKLFDKCEYDNSNIKLYGVDRAKSEPSGSLSKFKIERVPTLIILLGGTEIGRIVEFPIISWEEDILTIIEN